MKFLMHLLRWWELMFNDFSKKFIYFELTLRNLVCMEFLLRCFNYSIHHYTLSPYLIDCCLTPWSLILLRHENASVIEANVSQWMIKLTPFNVFPLLCKKNAYCGRHILSFGYGQRFNGARWISRTYDVWKTLSRADEHMGRNKR